VVQPLLPWAGLVIPSVVSNCAGALPIAVISKLIQSLRFIVSYSGCGQWLCKQHDDLGERLICDLTNLVFAYIWRRVTRIKHLVGLSNITVRTRSELLDALTMEISYTQYFVVFFVCLMRMHEQQQIATCTGCTLRVISKDHPLATIFV
jgi:hypothetical protein